MSASVRDASTVLLLRDGAAGVEVFLIRRPEGASFFGGAYVFPGGAVDAADQADAVLAHLGREQVAACAAQLDPTPGKELGAAAAAGSFVAACREVFEECGVLLGRAAGGGVWRPAASAVELEGLRQRLHAGEAALVDVLAQLGARLDLGALAYWAHWITPSVERKRFDTRFFLARLPEGQEAAIDRAEATASLWTTPAGALEASRRGDIVLPPPTFKNLEELAELTASSAGVAQLFQVAASRRVVAIQPKIGAVDGAIAILLPWDPSFPETDGETLPGVEYGPAQTDGTSRIVLEAGRWVSRRG